MHIQAKPLWLRDRRKSDITTLHCDTTAFMIGTSANDTTHHTLGVSQTDYVRTCVFLSTSVPHSEFLSTNVYVCTYCTGRQPDQDYCCEYVRNVITYISKLAPIAVTVAYTLRP